MAGGMVAALAVVAVLTVLVTWAMRAAAGGWDGVLKGSAVYTVAVALMAAGALAVILVLHAVEG